jgi:hypothetical protein
MVYTNYRAGWFIKIKPNQMIKSTSTVICDEITGEVLPQWSNFNPNTGNKVIRKNIDTEYPIDAGEVLYELTNENPNLEDTYAIVTTGIKGDDYIAYNYHNECILDCENSLSKTELETAINNKEYALAYYDKLIKFLNNNKIDYELNFWLLVTHS